MNRSHLYRRVVRRETHSPRTAAIITVMVILVVASVWFGAEILLHLLGLGPILIAPSDLLAGIVHAATVTQGALVGIGVGTALIGLFLLLLALAPGRRGRHARVGERTAVIVDDRTIASSLATRAARAAGTTREQLRVSVGKRRADVALTHTSGMAVDRDIVKGAVQDELDRYDLRPLLRAGIGISDRGVVGA
jgi:hypothetical protein